jgi:hypothetical protein
MSREAIDPAPVFTLDGHVTESETLYSYAGAHVLELATSIPDLGMHVETVYVTADGVGTQVTDLLIEAGEEILAARRLADFPISGEVALLRCLRDHAERVMTFLDSLGCGAASCRIGGGAFRATAP